MDVKARSKGKKSDPHGEGRSATGGGRGSRDAAEVWGVGGNAGEVVNEGAKRGIERGGRKGEEESSESDEGEEDEDDEEEEEEEDEEEEEEEESSDGDYSRSFSEMGEEESETRGSVAELIARVREGLVGKQQGMKSASAKSAPGSSSGVVKLEEEEREREEEEEDGEEGEGDKEESAVDSFMPTIQRDLLLSHLLRLVTGPKGPLPHALPTLAKQLQEMELLPQWALDLLLHRPLLVDRAFRRMVSSRRMRGSRSRAGGSDEEAAAAGAEAADPSAASSVAKFWSASPELRGGGEEEAAAAAAAAAAGGVQSRYATDFEEVAMLGKGGFGHVVLCTNKLDGRKYAVKKIKLTGESPSINSKILREVATLSRLQHQNVVRYYQAWYETGVGGFMGVLDADSSNLDGSEEWLTRGGEEASMSHSLTAVMSGREGREGGEGRFGGVQGREEDVARTTILYIQMEYCPRTLRQVLDTRGNRVDKELMWRMFRQLLEGLRHIHAQGVVHRDLTPNNIFFDARGDIKIGDFGLAKFMDLSESAAEDQLEEDKQHDDISREKGEEGVGFLSSGRGQSMTGQIGTYFYTAPEIEQGWPNIDEKVDMYSAGVVLFEMWHPFDTAMERAVLLNLLKAKGDLPVEWQQKHPQVAALTRRLVAALPSHRPSAADVLQSDWLPARMEDEALNAILRTIQAGDDTSVFDRVVSSLFNSSRTAPPSSASPSSASLSRRGLPPTPSSSPSSSSSASALTAAAERTPLLWVGERQRRLAAVRAVFERHGAAGSETRAVDSMQREGHFHRGSLRLLDSSGTPLLLRFESRFAFARWLAATQTTSLRRYEVAQVFRKGPGLTAPREYWQADFDIVGGEVGLTEAEAVKVVLEILTDLSALPLTAPGSGNWLGAVAVPDVEVRVNHRGLLKAIWKWAGVKPEESAHVAQLLAVMGGSPLRSATRKALWPLVRRQLLQGLGLSESVVERLQLVERRLSGPAEEAIARLRGALPANVVTSAALSDLSSFSSFLRIWSLDSHLSLDALMSPTDDFFAAIYFQVHVHFGSLSSSSSSSSSSNHGAPHQHHHQYLQHPSQPICIAVGGRYNDLVRRFEAQVKHPSLIAAVGVSIALQKLLTPFLEENPSQSDPSLSSAVLVCSRGGGGLLRERMQMAAEMWAAGLKAEFVPSSQPSLTEQYGYAQERHLKWLVILSETALSTTGSVKVRHLDLKTEEEVSRNDVVKFFTEKQQMHGGSFSKRRAVHVR